MASHKTLSGQVPLMQVSQQQPLDEHHPRLGPTISRMEIHTFVGDRSYSLPSAGSFISSTPNDQGDHLSIPPPTYKRISFNQPNAVVGRANQNNNALSLKPKRKRCRPSDATKRIRLKTFKQAPGSAEINADVWSIILAHTRPSFVMQMRTVSKFFYHITNTDTIWRDAREHHFGADMPVRPSFLTERQYAILLDGRGCQNPQCERRETKKVRWVFRLRLCDECLSRKLNVFKIDGEPSPQSRYASLFQTTTDREQFGTSIIDLLPTSGTWNGKPNVPRNVNRETGKWLLRSSSASPLLYLKSDFVVLEAEYAMIQEEDWEPQRVLEWVQEKYQNATKTAKTASDLEWWEFSKFSDNADQESTRAQRRKYFTQKARQLTPSMSEEVLSCFAAYQTSLASSNAPSERAWDMLLVKILPYRSLAEHVAQYVRTRYARPLLSDASSSTSPEIKLFNQLHEHRKTKRKETGMWSPQQRFVLDIAENEFEKLVDQVADEDLLLLCLRNVYNAYDKSPVKPLGLNFDGVFGEYRLSLDDAKTVVEEVIEKRIKKPTLRGVKVLESLKCMGCTRFVTGKRHSFQSAFEHMLEKHSKVVGKDLHFHRFLKYSKLPPECLYKDYKFPWYLVEWTRSLPLLPTHAEVNAETRWIPDEDAPYLPISKPATPSAFEGRHAVPNGDPSTVGFVDNFVHAAHVLSTTRLDSECIVKIAIRYGTDLSGPEAPSIEDFFACIKPTQNLGNGLPFKFRCGACNHRPEVNSHLRCVKHPVDIDILRKHWNEKHAHEKIDWSINLMDLPSEMTLLEVMLTQDEKLKQDQANSLERESVGLMKSAKKVADQKAGALMKKELAMEAFGRLFAKLE